MEKTALTERGTEKGARKQLLGDLPLLPGMDRGTVKPNYSLGNNDGEIQGRKKFLKKKKTKENKPECLSNNLDNVMVDLMDLLGFDTETAPEPGEAVKNSTDLSTLTVTPRGQLKPLTTSQNCHRTRESDSGKTPRPDLETTKDDTTTESTKAEEERLYVSPWNRSKPPSDDEESVIEEIIEVAEEEEQYSSEFDSYVSTEEIEGEDIERDPSLHRQKEGSLREPEGTVQKTVFLEEEEPEQRKKATFLPPLKGMTPRPERIQRETSLKGPCTSEGSSFLSRTPRPDLETTKVDATTESSPSSTLFKSGNKETKSTKESFLALNKPKQSDKKSKAVEEVKDEEHLVKQESGEDLFKDQSTVTYKARLPPRHWKSLRFVQESAETSVCCSGLDQDAELSTQPEKNVDFEMQQDIMNPVEEAEKEVLMKEKQKRIQEFKDALQRQEEEEERLLKAESERRIKALRQSLKAQRRKEESQLTRESEKRRAELKESLRAHEEEQERRLRQESNTILELTRTGIELEQERKITKLKEQKCKETQQLEEAHRREMDSITGKHRVEMEQLQASHSRELEKLNIQHQLNVEQMQKENSKVLELRENKQTSLRSQEKDLPEKTKCFASTEQMETLALVTYERDQLKEELKKKQQTLEKFKDQARTKIAQLKKEQERVKEESYMVKEELRWIRDDRDRLSDECDRVREECDRVRDEWANARQRYEREQKKEERNSLETQVKLNSLRISELEANVFKKVSENRGPNEDLTLVLEDMETPLSSPADNRARSSSRNDVSSCADTIKSNSLSGKQQM